MATLQELERGLRNAHAKFRETGDERHRQAARRFASEIRSLREPSIEDQRAQVADGMELRFIGMDRGVEVPQSVSEFFAGMGRRFSEIGTLGAHEPDAKVAELLDDSGAATAGGVVADMAAMAPLGAPGTAAKAALQGAGYAAATTGGDLKERASAAGAGAVGGAFGQGLAKAASRTLAPKVSGPAKELLDKGVRVTPGRLAGRTGSQIEDALESIPLTGSAIRARKTDAIMDYNKVIINEALEPVGETIDEVGRGGINKASQVLSNKYDDLLDGIDAVRLDDTFDAEVTRLSGLALGVDGMEAGLSQLDRVGFTKARDEFLRRFSGDQRATLGPTFKEAESELRAAYKRAYGKGRKKLGDALRTLFQSSRELLKRQHPEMADELARLDQSYAKLSVIKEASKYEGAQEGVFTPSHLLRAIKKNTSSDRFARGQGFDQAAAEAAKDVLSQTIPNSGTTDRALVAGAIGGAIDPLILGGMAAGGAANSRLGQSMMRGAMTARPPVSRELGQALELLAPLSSRAGTGVMIREKEREIR